MRRFDLSKRIRRCSSFTSGSARALKAGDLCKQERRPEEWEVTFAPRISARQRAYILGQHDLFCAKCGTAPGDIDDLTGLTAKFDIEIIAGPNVGRKDEFSNLQALCSTCNQGAKDITSEKPTWIWLLSQVRRAGQDEQLAVLKWLREKFKV